MSLDLSLPASEPVPPSGPIATKPSVAAQLGRFFYNHNPFYLISAFLTLYGIHAVFGVDTVGELKTASVLLAIGGYTAVLGLTGVLIVRFGKVWEDARTVLLAVILLLLATSVCTDELLMLAPAAALRLIVGGLIFAIGLCELIIRGLKIRFGAEFRIPLFIQLAILFLYPYFCASEVRDLTPEQVQWRVLGFPLVFSLGLTTLWPAILRGSARLKENGTPWNWPLYPWCLFLFIAGAGAFRCRILTESFDPTPGMAVTFGSFYLLPILLTVAWLVIETGIVEKRQTLVVGTLFCTLFLLLLALPGHRSGLQRDFYETVARNVGSPLFWCVIGLLSLYGCARLRGVTDATELLLFTLALLSFIGPETTGWSSARFSPWPLSLVGCFLIFSGWRNRATSTAAWGLALCAPAIPALCRFLNLEAAIGVAYMHYVFLSCVVLGLCNWDDDAGSFETIACWSVPILVALAVLKPEWLLLTNSGGLLYAGLLTAAALLLGLLACRPGYLFAGLAILVAVVGEGLHRAYRSLAGAVGPRGLWALSWSLASFVIAVLISSMKGGHLANIRQVRRVLAWIQQSSTRADT